MGRIAIYLNNTTRYHLFEKNTEHLFTLKFLVGFAWERLVNDLVYLPLRYGFIINVLL